MTENKTRSGKSSKSAGTKTKENVRLPGGVTLSELKNCNLSRKKASPNLIKTLRQFEKNMVEQMKEANQSIESEQVMDAKPSGSFHL